MHYVGIGLDFTFLVLLVVDFQLTPRPRLLSATREVMERLSIGRTNEVTISCGQHRHIEAELPG